MVKAEGGKDQESSAIGETSTSADPVVSSKKATHEVEPGTSTPTKQTQETPVGLSAAHLHHHHHATSLVDSTPDATRQVVSASGIDAVGSSEEDEVRAASPLHSSTTLTTAGSSSAGTSSVLGAIHGPTPYPPTHGIDPQGAPHLAGPELQPHQSHENVEHIPGESPPGQYTQGHIQLYDPTRGPGSNIGAQGSAPSRFPVAIKLLVSNNVAGSIIGRQGQTISELQSQSMTRIKLSQSGDYFPGTHDRVCLIQGEPGNIKVALRLLLHRMNMIQEQECSQRIAAWQQLQQPKQQMGGPVDPDSHQVLQTQQQQGGQEIAHPTFNFVVRLLVPTSSCGMIIGKAGSNIKYLEQASGVISVRLSPKDALAPTDANVPPAAMGGPNTSSTMERAVTITGPNMESCLQCSYMVFEGMLSHPDVSRYSNMTTTYARHKAQQQMMPHQMQMLEQQLAHTSLVGGAPGAPEMGGGMNQPPLLGHPNLPVGPSPVLPSGAPLQQQPQAGAIGPQPQPHPLEGTFGSEGNLTVASGSQTRMLDPSSSFPPQNESINSKRGYLVPVSPICLGPNTFQAQVAVPDSMIGSILGRAGRTLNELQALSGTRIWISQRGEYIPGTRNRIVTVRGPTAHSVWQAQVLINQQIVLPPTAGHIEDHS